MDGGVGGGDALEISDGVVTLDWSHDLRKVELQHHKPNGRKYIQEVTGDTRTVQSGLAEGLHRFQLRADGGAWGEVLVVKSSYMEHRKVVRLLVVGGVVVAAIVVAIVVGCTRSQEG